MNKLYTAECAPNNRNRSPRFQRVKAPDKGELEDLVQLISQRVGRCLERQGLLERDAEIHVAMTWAQRLKRVFNMDIEVCNRWRVVTAEKTLGLDPCVLPFRNERI